MNHQNKDIVAETYNKIGKEKKGLFPMLNEIYTNTFNLSQPIPLSKQFAMRIIDRNRQNGYAIISASMAESDANHPHQKEKLAELN